MMVCWEWSGSQYYIIDSRNEKIPLSLSTIYDYMYIGKMYMYMFQKINNLDNFILT